MQMSLVHDIPFEVTDLQTYEVVGTPVVSASGGLEWRGGAALPTSHGEADADQFSWCLSVDDYPIGGRALNVMVLTRAPSLSAESVGQMAAFLSGIEAKDAAVRGVVLAGFDTISSLGDYLVPGLLRNVEVPYLAMLFGERERDDAISAEEFLRGVTLSAIRYQVDASGAGSFTMDYRLLVPSLIDADKQNAERFLVFGGGYDITNQVLAAKFSGAGELLDLSIES